MPLQDILKNGVKVGEQMVDDPIIITHNTSMSKTDFKGSFTPTEYRAISVLCTTDDNAFQFWDMAQTADHIEVTDSRTIAGLTYLSSKGVFDSARLATLLLGNPV